MHLPLFLFDGNDLNIFSSAELLLNYVEVVDVEDQVYECYDARGCKFDLVAPEALGQVLIGDSAKESSDEFRSRLQSVIRAIEGNTSVDQLTDCELMETAIGLVGYYS